MEEFEIILTFTGIVITLIGRKKLVKIIKSRWVKTNNMKREWLQNALVGLVIFSSIWAIYTK